MRIIKTLTGTGEMKADGTSLGSVRYHVTAFRNDRNMLQARGVIHADIPTLLAAFYARKVTLTRQDTGGTLQGIVTKYDLETGTAAIELAGTGLDD